MRGEKWTHAFDHAIAELAGRQHGVVGRWQLRDLGIPDASIDRRVAAGRLHRLHRGVFAVGHRAISVKGKWMGAALASGPGAVLSHSTAAALWQIRDPRSGPVHVTIGKKSGSTASIRRHYSLLPDDETTTVESIPVTTIPRTIFDMAASTSLDRVESMLREAEYRRLYDRLSLPDLLRRYPGRRGTQRLRTALARVEALPSGRTRSPLEERFLPFLRQHGLPRPRLNDWIMLGARRYQVDCHWPGTDQIVELDGWSGHGTRTAFREDRARDRALRVAGYSVTRIAWAQLEDEPDAIAADLRALLADYKRM
jgi:very-short-patch-repair endonuclease/predicted transcriptional regulator of viral defense system